MTKKYIAQLDNEYIQLRMYDIDLELANWHIQKKSDFAKLKEIIDISGTQAWYITLVSESGIYYLGSGAKGQLVQDRSKIRLFYTEDNVDKKLDELVANNAYSEYDIVKCYITSDNTKIAKKSPDIRVKLFSEILNSPILSREHIGTIKRVVGEFGGLINNSSKASIYIYLSIKENGSVFFINKQESFYLSKETDNLFMHNVNKRYNITDYLPRIISEETRIEQHRVDIDSKWYNNVSHNIENTSRIIQEIIHNKKDNTNTYSESSIKKLCKLADDYKYYGNDKIYYIIFRDSCQSSFYSESHKNNRTALINNITFFTDLKQVNNLYKDLSKDYNDGLCSIITLHI